MVTLPSSIEDIDGSGSIEPDEQWAAYMILAGQQLDAQLITQLQFGNFLVNRGKYYNFPIAEGTSLEDLCLDTYEPSDESVPYTPFQPPKKLLFNNGNLPIPAANEQVTLREYEGGPMAQQDAEFNFINLTDRVNTLIDNSSSTDAALSSSIDATNKIIANINFALDNLTQSQIAITNQLVQAQADIVTNRDAVPSRLTTADSELIIDATGNLLQEKNKKILIGTTVDEDVDSTGAVNIAGDGQYRLNVSSMDSNKVTLAVAGTVIAEQIVSANAGNLDIATLNARLEAVEIDTGQLKATPSMGFLSKEKNINTNARGYLDYSMSSAGVPGDAVSVLLSIQHRGNAYPSMTFAFFTADHGGADNTSIKHEFRFNSSDKSQTTHNSIWVPVVDGKIYYYIDANNSWSVNIHAYSR